MKSWSRILAALVLAISMVFSTWPNVATAEARPLASASAAASEADFSTSSQGLKDLEADKKKNPNKQIGSSFRRIPPSTPNPTQNKTSRNQEHRKPKHKLAAMAGEGAVIPLGKKAEADPGLAAIAAHYNGPETITARPNRSGNTTTVATALYEGLGIQSTAAHYVANNTTTTTTKHFPTKWGRLYES
ncbi:hypothetical protein COP2_025244 [Malus domestica]